MKNSLLLLLGALCPIALVAQGSTEIQEIHKEVEDQAYIYVDRATMPKSAAYNVLRSELMTTQVNIDNDGNNIVGDAANEPSLAIDPTNPDRIVVGWRQFDNINNNFRQAGYGYSQDGGLSFTFPGPINPGVFRSDPVLDFDNDGNLYYNSLQSDFSCDVYKIENGGFAWDGPFPAKGGDKQWMRIDRTDGIGSKNNYSNWNESFTTCAPGYFTRSTDDSETYEDCIGVDGSPRWGTLAVNSDGDLYIVGLSNNTGEMIVVKSTTAKDASQAVTWESNTVVDLDGTLMAGAPINPQGLTGQAWVDVDLSNDNVYVLASVVRNSITDPADVMFAKSTDGGQTFAPPIKINTNTDTTSYQWFGTMSVAPNGRIDVVWLDTRDAPAGTNDSVLYYSYSEDQGETWTANEAISQSFDPNIGYPQQNKMGDYFDMKSDNNFAHLAWANTINGGQDVYYTRISPEILSIGDLVENSFEARVYPNPFNESTTIGFNLAGIHQTTVDIYDTAGRKVRSLLNETTTGKQQLQWNGTNNNGQNLSSGLYFATIRAENKSITLKVILN